MTTKVPSQLRAGIAALFIAMGGGYATYAHIDNEAAAMTRNAYIQAAAADQSTSDAVKVALVMASYYESSYRHIGRPYVDKLGKGQPWTVCNGLTSHVAKIDPQRYYTPADCYRMESKVYNQYELSLQKDVPGFTALTVLQQASFLDFAHNKGMGAWGTSKMRRKLLAGGVVSACRENERWTRGTVGGVSTVLPGLKVRGDANSDLCAKGLE